MKNSKNKKARGPAMDLAPSQALGPIGMEVKQLSNNSKNRLMQLFGALEGEKAAIDGMGVDTNSFDSGQVYYNRKSAAQSNAVSTIRQISSRLDRNYTPKQAQLEVQPQVFYTPQTQIQLQPQPQIQQRTISIQNNMNDNFMNYINGGNSPSSEPVRPTDLTTQISMALEPLISKLDTLCKIIGYYVNLQKNGNVQMPSEEYIEQLVSKKVAEALDSAFASQNEEPYTEFDENGVEAEQSTDIT